MATEKTIVRELTANVKLRSVTFSDARKLMDELEKRWIAEFPDSSPVNALIEATFAFEQYEYTTNIQFIMNNKGSL